MAPGFPGWKSSVVQPQTHTHNFYSAEHSGFSYTCGAQADETVTLSYKFKLFFDEGENSLTREVSFEKSIFALPPKE